MVFNIAMVVVISIVAVLLNFIIVPKIQKLSYQNRALIEESSVEHAKLGLPVAVLKNLNNQKNEGKDMSEAHTEAFNRNKQTIMEVTTDLTIKYESLFKAYDQIDTISLGRHKAVLDACDEMLTSLKTVASDFNQLISSQELSEIEIDPILLIYDEQEALLSELVELGKSLERMLVKDVAVIVNTIVIVLIVLLAILGYVVARYVRGDFLYMMKGLELISKRDYALDQLPVTRPVFSEESKMVTFVEGIMNKIRFTKELRDIVSKYYLVDDVIEVLFSKLQEEMPIDRLGVAFVDYNKGKIIAEHSAINGGKLFLKTGFEQDITASSLKEVIITGKPTTIADMVDAYKNKPQSPSLALLTKEGMKSNMVIPLKMGQAVFGMLFFSSKEINYFSAKEIEIGEGIGDEIAALLNKSYFTKIIFTRITSSFSELVEGKDTSTGEHIERMVQYCVVLANGVKVKNQKGYELSERDVLDLERHASSHDIGKVGIPDAILKKPGKLTPDEWSVMKTHATIGADIFAHLREGLMMFDPEFFKTAEDIARSHHEKWDGSGYPNGLANDAIPLVGRIVAIADVFDALTSQRVYKGAYTFDEAVRIIREGKGKHFDPFLVEVFNENLDSFKTIYDR